ncbi:hypothetical protein OROHE_021935 [Orobanche hederae]
MMQMIATTRKSYRGFKGIVGIKNAISSKKNQDPVADPTRSEIPFQIVFCPYLQNKD